MVLPPSQFTYHSGFGHGDQEVKNVGSQEMRREIEIKMYWEKRKVHSK
jgi:hypothetical protein